MAVTLKDVAQRVGLSVPTVSEILRNDPNSRIASDTRQRVLQAARELGYSHNVYARVLSTGKSRLIGLLMSGLDVEIGLSKLQAIDTMIRSNEYSTVMRTAGYRIADAVQVLKDFAGRMAEGVVAVQGFDSSLNDAVSSLRKQGTPVVSIEPVVGLDVDYVTVDRRYGVYAATKHLIETGHEKIAFLHSDLSQYTGHERFLGYKEALEESGMQVDEGLMIPYAYEISSGPESGYDAMKVLLARKTGLTAVICNNDHLAFGAMSAILAAGIKIPEDIAVIGFDNISLSAYAPVPLTTVQQPVQEIAKTATEILFKRIEGVKLPAQTIAIKPTLVVRQSSKRPA